MKVKEFAENAIAEYEQVDLEDVFGTPDKLKAYRLLLAADEVVEKAKDFASGFGGTISRVNISELRAAITRYDTLVNEIGGGE